MVNTGMTRDTVQARKAMIDSQLRTSGVNEEFVLVRMMAVPREDYLPKSKTGLAYIDRSVALGDKGSLASPVFYGKLLLEAAPMPHDRVLLVQSGTEYLAELVRPMVNGVTVVSAADAAAGSLPEGTFTLILIDGAIEQLPESFASSLEENGRIVGGLLLRKVTRIAVGRKIGNHLPFEPVEDIGIPVLAEFHQEKSWTF